MLVFVFCLTLALRLTFLFDTSLSSALTLYYNIGEKFFNIEKTTSLSGTNVYREIDVRRKPSIQFCKWIRPTCPAKWRTRIISFFCALRSFNMDSVENIVLHLDRMFYINLESCARA